MTDRELARELLGDYGMSRGAIEKIAAHVRESNQNLIAIINDQKLKIEALQNEIQHSRTRSED